MLFFNEHYVFLVVHHIWEARSIDRFCHSGKDIKNIFCDLYTPKPFCLFPALLSSFQIDWWFVFISEFDGTVISKIHLEFLIWRLAARSPLFLYLELSAIYMGSLSLKDVIESLCCVINRVGCFFRIYTSRNQIDDNPPLTGFLKFLNSNV